MNKLTDCSFGLLPREKALQNGITSLDDNELLAIILGRGTKDCSVLVLSNLLLSHFDTLKGLKNAKVEDLCDFKGVSKVQALRVLASLELGVRLKNRRDQTWDKKRIIEDAKKRILEETQEVVILYSFSDNMHLLDREIIFKGNEKEVAFSYDLIRKKLRLWKAKKYVLIHNHPSGVSFPSSLEITQTEELKKQEALRPYELLDHIIFGNDRYFSFKENKLI